MLAASGLSTALRTAPAAAGVFGSLPRWVGNTVKPCRVAHCWGERTKLQEPVFLPSAPLICRMWAQGFATGDATGSKGTSDDATTDAAAAVTAAGSEQGPPGADASAPAASTSAGTSAADLGDYHTLVPRVVVFGGSGFVGSRVCQQVGARASACWVLRDTKPSALPGWDLVLATTRPAGVQHLAQPVRVAATAKNPPWPASRRWQWALLLCRSTAAGGRATCTATGLAKWSGCRWAGRQSSVWRTNMTGQEGSARSLPRHMRCRAPAPASVPSCALSWPPAGRCAGPAAAVAGAAQGGGGGGVHHGSLWQQRLHVQGGGAAPLCPAMLSDGPPKSSSTCFAARALNMRKRVPTARRHRPCGSCRPTETLRTAELGPCLVPLAHAPRPRAALAHMACMRPGAAQICGETNMRVMDAAAAAGVPRFSFVSGKAASCLGPQGAAPACERDLGALPLPEGRVETRA